jgi:Glycosyl hydrolases family 43/Ca-dependent carbohydrate-binding module xylan-binding
MRVVLRALIACLCMVAVTPAAAQAVTFQAEHGTKLRGAVVKRGGSVLLKGRATVSKQVRTGALLRVHLRARGRTCRGRPVMRISLDGRTVKRVRVGSTRWRTYGGAKTARRGRHTVVIRLVNPKRTRSCRREIAVDRVILAERRTPPAEPPAQAQGALGPLPGMYVNPVHTGPAGGGFADPTVLKTDSGYWAYATGGLFLLARSTDLVHWTDQGVAMSARPAWTDQTGEWNPWAPSVIARSQPCPGKQEGPCYVMFFVSVNRSLTPDVNCIGVATSPSPGGPFTDRGILEDEAGSRDQSDRPIGCGDDDGYSNIDPAPFVDADGTPYLYLSTGHRCMANEPPNTVCPWDRELSAIPLTDDLMNVTGARQPLMGNDRGWDQGIVENPWASRQDGSYELLFSGGNFARTYGMGAARSGSAASSFSRIAPGPFLGDRGHVLSAGGGMVVSGPRGDDWVAYHGRQGRYDQPRTLRIDPISRGGDGTVSTPAPSSTARPSP